MEEIPGVSVATALERLSSEGDGNVQNAACLRRSLDDGTFTRFKFVLRERRGGVSIVSCFEKQL